MRSTWGSRVWLAAREGVRVATMTSTETTSPVVTAVQEHLQSGGMDPTKVTVTVTPSALGDLQTGDPIDVDLSAQMRSVSWLGAVFPNANLSSSIRAARE